MISIRNLTVVYNNIKHVLNDLSLDLNHGLIHGIVGLNGAGKTTLLHTMYGLKAMESGEILFNKTPINKKQIAFLPTENFFYSNITGYEFLALFENNNFDLNSWNELFGLPLSELIDNYSTGMKKKLALLATLKQDKSVIILDEPFNGLDIETSRMIRLILLKLVQNGKTIIITSHIIETLTNLCDMIHFLEKGIIKQSINKSDFDTFETNLIKSIEEKSIGKINKLL